MSANVLKEMGANSCIHGFMGLVFDIDKAGGTQIGDHFVEFFFDFPAVSGIALPSRWDKLFSGSSDRTVHVWDCDTGQSIIVINLGDKIWALISKGPGYLHGTLRQLLKLILMGQLGKFMLWL
ncbi:hypothetical protein GH714_043154 [Hevea brasiliensis]|uniref:Uncharacterized protein n=1 Tax=Hevea brasiliensis TaxID=3981 RepID=A0A6A6K244_HEVBR|nr:hypothetical protein GH714_043154 [Hevea brasiliensis]